MIFNVQARADFSTSPEHLDLAVRERIAPKVHVETRGFGKDGLVELELHVEASDRARARSLALEALEGWVGGPAADWRLKVWELDPREIAAFVELPIEPR
jgi:hypothetical protein